MSALEYSVISSYYPDDTQPWHLCIMEGHHWRGGGACVNCGERLRCGCGRFARDNDAWWTEHFKVCPLPGAAHTEDCAAWIETNDVDCTLRFEPEFCSCGAPSSSTTTEAPE